MARKLSREIERNAVPQGGFVLPNVKSDRAPLIDALPHLHRYFMLLFQKPRT